MAEKCTGEDDKNLTETQARKKNKAQNQHDQQQQSKTSGRANSDFVPPEKKKSYAERLCAFYVKKPKLAFAISLGIQLSFLLATGALYVMQYDIFPYDFTIVPLNLEKDSTKLRTDAFKFVTEDPRINLLPTTAIPQAERTLKASPLELVYKANDEGANILTPANLKAIRDLETALIKEPSYRKICHRDATTNTCSLPMSIIRLFDGSYSGLYDPEFQNIQMILNTAKNISQIRPLISYALDKSSVINQNHTYSHHIRSVVFNGLPLKGYKHGEDRKQKQLNVLKINVVEAFGKMLSEKYESGIGDMKLYYMNMDLFFNAVESQVVWDLLLAGGSLIFIFSFIWFQTGSLWITGWAVFGIITNFFGANLVYRIVLDFRFIGIFHVLSVFMILGIGADDVFVFFNTWKLMEAKNFTSLTQHLTETFRIAAGAMFVTSLTTAAAFLASAASPLLGVASFGVFSGILVIVNYISVCIYFPSVVVTYHYFWKDYRPFRCCSNNQNKDADRKLLAIDQNGTPDRNEAPQDEMTKMFKAVVRWFETFYANRIVMGSKVKWILLAFFGSLTVLLFVFAMQIGPDEKQIQVWPRGTNWYDIRQTKIQAFEETGEGNNVIRIYTVWGLKLQDRTSCHFTDFRCKGRTVFDEEFDLNKPGCQSAVLDFCRRLKSLPKERAEELHIRRSVATGELEVSCFIDEMDKYFKSEYMNMLQKRVKYSSPSPSHHNISFGIPMDATKTRILMGFLPEIYNTSALTSSFNRYFEVALGFWLSGGGHPDKKFDYYKYSSYMGGSLDSSVTPEQKESIVARAQGGRYGNILRYVAVVVNTTLTGPTLKYTEGLEASKKWEDYMQEEIKRMPPSCNKPFQCTPEWNEWHWLKVQGELLKGAKIGILIGLTLAFPVLVFTTCNWVIGLLATLTIALITICVVGLIPLVGWSLGVMESINLTLVVGLAVDYAVHLADGYVRCEYGDRTNRVRHMLGNVGVSVLAGASTTLGASAFMLGSKILFFFQFGIFIFCTIGFSIVYALVVFTIIIGLIGPQDDKGSLWSIITFFKRGTPPENSRAELVLHADNLNTIPKTVVGGNLLDASSSCEKDKIQKENIGMKEQAI